ncbi:MAG TPA: alanine racemase [Vitreimonas sp.]|nr:alanine racemase [Vitreimonas sp.]
MPMSHPAWIEVDTSALVHNAGVLRRAIPTGTRLGLMVKANGYGHGLELAARAAVRADADLLMVATLDEALAVRAAGIDAPLLVVYPIPPDGVGEAVAAGVQLSVSGLDSARRLLRAWEAWGQGSRDGLALHVEIDTGMGRGGVAPDALVDVAAMIEAVGGARVESAWTHLADGSDAGLSGDQTRRFEEGLAQLEATGRGRPMRHVAATEGLFVGTSPAYDMVRIGLAYYGELGVDVEPAPSTAALAAQLRPAMTVKARAVRLESVPSGASIGYGREWTTERPSVIATLPVGYADGWARRYWPGASALVRGHRVPLVGRVSMDSVCADVTGVPDVRFEDEFVLLGIQGTERITANELARLRESIPNEVFCAFGPRLPRVERTD